MRGAMIAEEDRGVDLADQETASAKPSGPIPPRNRATIASAAGSPSATGSGGTSEPSAGIRSAVWGSNARRRFLDGAGDCRHSRGNWDHDCCGRCSRVRTWRLDRLTHRSRARGRRTMRERMRWLSTRVAGTRLLSRTAFHIATTAGFVMLLSLAASVLVLWLNWDHLGWFARNALGLAVLLLTPGLRDIRSLFLSYEGYRRAWEQIHRGNQTRVSPLRSEPEPR